MIALQPPISHHREFRQDNIGTYLFRLDICYFSPTSLSTEEFSCAGCHTKKLLHQQMFAPNRLHANKFVHQHAFAPASFYTKKHQECLTRKGFYTNKLTQTCFCTNMIQQVFAPNICVLRNAYTPTILTSVHRPKKIHQQGLTPRHF